MPPGAMVAVTPADAGQRSQRLKAVVSRALTDRGFRTGEAAPIRLEFTVKDELRQSFPGRDGSDVEARGSGGSQSRTEIGVGIRIAPERQELHYEGELSISLTLYRPGEVPLWVATVSAPRPAEDDPEVRLEGMVHAAFEAFGRTEDRAIAVD